MLQSLGTLYIAAEVFEVGEKGLHPLASALAGIALVLFQVPRLRAPVFVAFLLGSTARILAVFPDVPNHVNLYLLSHLILLGVLARSAMTRQDLETGLRGGEDLLRWCLLLVYAAAAFHKLNGDFLNPEVSCAVGMVVRFDYLTPFDLDLVSFLVPLLPALGLIWEAALPVLLVIRRVQWLGVLLAFALHFGLSFVFFADFAAAALPFLYLYLPADVRQRVYESPGAGWRALRIYAVLAAFYPWVTLGMLAIGDQRHLWRLGQGFYFAACATLLLAPLAVHLWENRRWEGVPMLPALQQPLKLAVLSLLVVYSFTPYLGLRSAGNFSMFSNLIVWTPRANHLLVPTSWKVFDYTDDLVWFESVDARVRESHRDAPLEEYGLPAIELKKLVRGWREDGLTGVHMSFRYRNEVHDLTDITQSSSWNTLPAWQRWFLDFRSVQPHGANECRW